MQRQTSLEKIITQDHPEQDMVRLWIMRALFRLGFIDKFLGKDGFFGRYIATALGLSDLLENYDRAEAMKRLKKDHALLEKKYASGKLGFSTEFNSNLVLLQTVTGLNEIEIRLLRFFVLMEANNVLSDMCSRWLDDLSLSASRTMLSALLEMDNNDITRAFSGRSRLVRCGLLSISTDSCSSMRHRFDVLNGLSQKLFSDHVRADDFLANVVRPGKAPTLGMADYQHISKHLQLMECYLQSAFDDRRQGVNVLVYGSAGTGKTELVRMLAARCEVELCEVVSEDEDGDPIKGVSRLRAYKAAQQFFSQRQAMILFDEMQDVFDDGDTIFGRSTAQLRKAEINTLLEENPLPTFWLSNDASCMDPAFIRRFDIVLELDVPHMGRRREILQAALNELPLQPAAIQRFAKHPHLSPAVVQRAAAVMKTVQASLDESDVPEHLECLFNQTLQAQGYACVQKAAANDLPEFYDPQFINADVDLTVLADGIRRNPSARICLYGPPGTGKSAFAQWLAQQLQRPFHNKKLSDILSMWVGGTEKNLQRAFRDAERDNAVLLLDEVDSFLRDRRQAQRSWEVTQVNEMLTQMESFNGLFIASTNLMDNLDQAALRRFDLKIRLGYLQPEQAWSLFCAQCGAMEFIVPESLKAQVHALQVLTPGDFAAVQRRHRFHPVQDAAALADSLLQECAVKEDGQVRRIGFV